MPEGDTVYRTAQKLKPLTGQVLTESDFRIPSLALTDLAGRTVLETVSRGKHLLTRLEGGITVHSHLKMEGRWDVQKPADRWRRPEHEARVVLCTEPVVAIGFSVLVDVVPTPAESNLVGHLGPDLLGPDWDPEEALRRLERQAHVPIGMALLDQRNLAGIGNVYRAELCFLSGVDPHSPVSAVKDLPRMVGRAHQMLVAHKDRSSRVTTGDTRPGRRLWVYGRKGPCLRCGTPIRKDEFGPDQQERIAYWCPACQPPV